MAMAKIFRNTVPNCNVIHPDGRIVTFHGGKHITSIAKDADFLQQLADANEAGVFIDANEFEVDTEELTPEGMLKKIKREAVEEFLAQQKLAAQHNSSSAQGNVLGAATSANIVNSLESNGEATVKSAEPAPAATAGVKVTLPTK